MNFGILDLPGFVLGPIDHSLAILSIPALLRVLLWGALAGYASMWIYRRYSPQQRIAEVRAELATAQRHLAAFDGEFSGLPPLIRAQFGLALRQLRLTAGAALLAAAPMLLVLPWLSNQFGVSDPEPESEIRVCAEPAEAASKLNWSSTIMSTDAPGCYRVVWPAKGGITVVRENTTPLLTLPLHSPANIVHKWHLLNSLVGNPAGYLSDNSAISAIRLDVPTIELIGWGPAWLRGWEAAFLFSALVFSLWLRWRWKLS